ncbi:Rv1733c family protein [Mycobacterium branderi]|uniref:Membrane protein n=2 Tax=Mycobacterium branderi TaxID=43348 RepID=A0A7I7W5D6_9MYCO|nr:hypothetical protein BST20_16830 [Mycobacterium branderi]BBZ12784.1 membrane protein [Mycobacterium branderi]
METFVLRPASWPVLQMFSRNPLVRRSDRIEAAVLALSVLVVLLAAACAGALGTVVHDARTQQYAEQARTRHAVVAIAIDDANAMPSPEIPYTVYARWRLNDTDHAGSLTWDSDVKAGELLHIWVDDDGKRVASPTPISRATTDAAVIAIVTWLSVVLAAMWAVDAVRTHVGHMRDVQWEQEIWNLVEGDGGRTNWAQ